MAGRAWGQLGLGFGGAWLPGLVLWCCGAGPGCSSAVLSCSLPRPRAPARMLGSQEGTRAVCQHLGPSLGLRGAQGHQADWKQNMVRFSC